MNATFRHPPNPKILQELANGSIDQMQNLTRAARLITQYTPNPEKRQALLEILHSRPTTDAYYQLYYRNTDYYPLRWLRALGSQVEILLPGYLQEEMAREIQNTWNLYK